MKTITLIKNLEMGGVTYNEGDTIDVEDDVYDYLMKSYMDERRAMIEEMQKHEEYLASIEKKDKKAK